MHHPHTLPTLKRVLKPMALSIQLALYSGMILMTQSVLAENVSAISYNIAAGDLAQTLNQFAVQSGISLSTEGTKLQALKSNGITGHYSIEQGFQTLLSGTGFEVTKGRTGYILTEKLQSQPQARNMGQLNQIDVHAQGQRTGGNIAQLPVITVNAETTDGSADQGYVAKKLKSVGPWGEKSLQDTPYSMSVMSSSLIENAIAGDMDQIYKMNPVVQNTVPASSTGNKAYAVIRGFHTQMGVMDGIRLSSYSTGISMEELDRVEIINGLTGFMYGVGNVGGTTNYVLKRPTYDRLTNITVGNYGKGQWFGHIDLGDKIDDEGIFAYRFNAAYQNGETGRSNQNVEKALLSGALDWNITDDVLLQLEAAHTEYRLDGIESRFYAYANSKFGALNYWLKPLATDKTYTPEWTYWDTTTDRIGLNLKYDINDIFTFRTAYMYKKDTQDSIGVYPVYFADSGWVNGWGSRSAPSDNIAQGAYAYLDSVFKTGNIQHKLTLGASADKLDYKEHENGYISIANSPVYTNPEGLMRWEKPAILNTTNWGKKYKSSSSNNSNIILGDDIRFNHQWSALLGLNYTTVKSDSYDVSGQKTTSGYDKSKLTPTASILFKPSEQLTTYATYMEGLEQGEIVPNDASQYNNPGEILDPSISYQYEIGAKYAFNDNLLLSSALFRIEQANSYEETTPDGKITMSQDGLAVHQGIELSLTGKVTDHLTVMAGGTYINPEVDKASNKALEGKKPTGVSNTLAKIYAEYQVPELEGLSLTGGAYYSGTKYKDSANLQKMDDYTIFDIGARYQTSIQSIPTSFNFTVANLTGKDYWATVYSLGAPRTIAFSIKTEF